ncbi:uncharacterized protein LOC144127990 isoform X1 [Amblyomma americanum]
MKKTQPLELRTASMLMGCIISYSASVFSGKLQLLGKCCLLSHSVNLFSHGWCIDVNSLFWYRRFQYGPAVHIMLVEARAADCSKCATSYSQQDCCVDVTSPFRATV